MIRRRFWASVWLFCCLLAKAESKYEETENTCINLVIPEEDLTAQRKIMSRLDSFLERIRKNQDKGLLTLRDEDDLMSQRKIMARLDSFLERNQDKGPQILRDEDDLMSQRKIMGRLDSFLERNQDKGPQTLRDVLAVAGKEKKNLDIKIGQEDPLEAVLLRYLIFLHQDIQTLLEVKKMYECSRPVKVFCDMETDGGGWTVFLSRAKVFKPVNFSRNWYDYKTGFGTPGEEHWLGNEHLHTLTSTRKYILRLEAQDGFGRETWGEWNTFSVDSESNLYNLTAVDQSPDSIADNDWFDYCTGRNFSTFDRDNDEAKVNCAAIFKGGWWYESCTYFNPTGVHDKKVMDGIRFVYWSKQDKTIRYATNVQLKIRPK